MGTKRSTSLAGGHGRTAAVLAMALCAAGCTVFDPLERDARERETAAQPALVAWLAAEIAREQFPDIDPLGVAGAPLIECGPEPERYLVFATRRQGGMSRCRANGRLQIRRFELEDGDLAPTPPEFAWRPIHETRTCRSHAHVFEVEVVPARGRTIVRSFARGSALDAVARLDAVLDVVDETMRLSTLGTEPALLVAPLRALLARAERAPRSGALARILAWPQTFLGTVLAEVGELDAGRNNLRMALDRDPTFIGARARLASLDLRAAWPGLATSQLARIARDLHGTGDPVQLLAAQRFERLRTSVDGRTMTSTAPMARAAARARIARGDLESGTRWMVRASSVAALHDTDMSLWADLLREKHFPMQALALRLALLAEGRAAPEAVLDTCREAIRLARPTAALRLLAAHWEALQADPGTRAEADWLLADLGARLGPAWATRVLFADDHAETLTTRQLRRLLRSGTGRRSAVALFARLQDLRREADDRGRPVEEWGSGPRPDRDPGWWMAPGVAPPR